VSPHFTFRVPFRAGGADEQLFAIAAFDGIDGLIEPDRFLGVLVELDLVVAWDEPGEADAEEPDQQAAVI